MWLAYFGYVVVFLLWCALAVCVYRELKDTVSDWRVALSRNKCQVEGCIMCLGRTEV